MAYHVEERNWMLPYGATLATISTVVIALRLYSRMPNKLGLDDFIIVIAWMLSIVSTALTIWLCADFGMNRHVEDVPPILWPGAFKINFIISFIGLSGTSLTKVSILLFYRRLVDGVFSRRLKWSIWSAILFVVVFTVAFMAFTLVECTPVQSSWEAIDISYHGPHKCMSPRRIQVISIIFCALSIVTDFVTVTLPAYLLFAKTQIRFTRSQRIALIVIFFLGYLTVAAGIARTVYLSEAVDPKQWDKTWIGFNSFVAGLAEANLGFICACAPSLNRLFGKFFASSSVHDSKHDADSNSGLRRSEKSPRIMQGEQHSDSLGAGGEVEDLEMRLYSKPLDMFDVDDATNTSNAGISNALD